MSDASPFLQKRVVPPVIRNLCVLIEKQRLHPRCKREPKRSRKVLP